MMNRTSYLFEELWQTTKELDEVRAKLFHELRDESGNVIHACATGSFPLPEDHWIYQEPLEPEHHLGGLYDDDVQANIEEKTLLALKYTIQVCTERGKDTDFDPDAVMMTFRNTLFGVGKYCNPSA